MGSFWQLTQGTPQTTQGWVGCALARGRPRGHSSSRRLYFAVPCEALLGGALGAAGLALSSGATNTILILEGVSKLKTRPCVGCTLMTSGRMTLPQVTFTGSMSPMGFSG